MIFTVEFIKEIRVVNGFASLKSKFSSLICCVPENKRSNDEYRIEREKLDTSPELFSETKKVPINQIIPVQNQFVVTDIR